VIEGIRVVLQTQDFARMRAFYEDKLDMRPLVDWDLAEDDRGVVLVFTGRTSTTSIEILTVRHGDGGSGQIDAGPAEAGHPDGEAADREAAVRPDRFALGLEVANVGATYEDIVARGVTIVEEPENKPWGHRSFSVRDPDGLLITIYQDMNR